MNLSVFLVVTLLLQLSGRCYGFWSSGTSLSRAYFTSSETKKCLKSGYDAAHAVRHNLKMAPRGRICEEEVKSMTTTKSFEGQNIDLQPEGRRRRRLLSKSIQSVVSMSLVGFTKIFPSAVLPSVAVEDSANANEVFLRLKSIPTFCIVDSKTGVPFMIFDGQAGATGYFFLSFDVAAQALKDARTKDTNAGASQVWSEATIVVVPLTVALQLTLRKSQREAINTDGIKFNTYNDIVPSQEGVNDAKAIEGESKSSISSRINEKWEQKGRVPLFYIPELRLANGREPRYFNVQDLKAEWARQNPENINAIPAIQVVEMVDLFRLAVKNKKLDAISNLDIIPVAESSQIARVLIQNNKDDSANGRPTLPKYDFNKVFLVGSAKG